MTTRYELTRNDALLHLSRIQDVNHAFLYSSIPTLIEWAAANGRLKAVQYLLGRGALHVSAALRVAIAGNYLNVARVLWAAGGTLPLRRNPYMHFSKAVVDRYHSTLNILWTAVERAQRATLTLLCIRRTPTIGTDVMRKIAKMVWETRRDWEAWLARGYKRVRK